MCSPVLISVGEVESVGPTHLSSKVVAEGRGTNERARVAKLWSPKVAGVVLSWHSAPVHPGRHSQRSFPGEPTHLKANSEILAKGRPSFK